MRKIFLYLIIAAAIGVLGYFLFPYAVMLCSEEGRAVIDEKVRSFGVFAPLAFIGVEILQIILAVIPGAPVEVMSGVLFGPLWGVVWCFAGIFIGTAIVFTLVRKLGRPFVLKMFPKEKLQRFSLLNNEKKLALTVFILFAIPGTPKDFLTYIAGLTKISPLKFFIIASVARTPSMACSVFMGANLGQGRFTVSIILLAVIILLSVIGYFVKNKFIDKKDSDTLS